jgi:putative MATE family efflux protein
MKSILQIIKEALQGKEVDYTSISVKRALILLSIPMVIEMAMESLFAVVDVYFVGKLGSKAVTTVGLTESVLTIIYSIGFGVSMAATAVVARRVGEKNTDAAKRAAGQTLFIGIVLSLIISVIGLFYSQDILQLMGASPELASYGDGYMFWMLLGNGTILLLFLLNGVFRGAGNAAIAMRVLWISNGINIVLDPMLILGLGPFPELGLDGAAYATNIGRGIGVAYQLFVLFTGKSVVSINIRSLLPDMTIILKILQVSAGGTGQFIISSASWIFLMRMMSEFGEGAVAGYTIAIRVLIFTILPAWGLANAAATLVGQNLGAQQPERASKSVWVASLYNAVFLGLVSVVYFVFAKPIIATFTTDPQALETGIECLRYLALGYVFFAYGMVMTQAFNGAGDTTTPTILNVIMFWLIQLPLSYLLAMTLDLGPVGIFLGIIISETLLAIAALWLFKRGKWKEKVV